MKCGRSPDFKIKSPSQVLDSVAVLILPFKIKDVVYRRFVYSCGNSSRIALDSLLILGVVNIYFHISKLSARTSYVPLSRKRDKKSKLITVP
jgi:hypothetical protein